MQQRIQQQPAKPDSCPTCGALVGVVCDEDGTPTYTPLDPDAPSELVRCTTPTSAPQVGIIDLWTNTMSYLCRAHLQAEFDAIRPAPLDALERAVVATSLAALAAETRLGESSVMPLASMAEADAERLAAADAYTLATRAWRELVAALVRARQAEAGGT